MAIIKGSPIEFSGSLGPMTAYRRQDSDKTILRTKGGASKEKVYTAASMQRTRENFVEFSLCGKMGGIIRRSMIDLAPLANYNFTPKLNALAKVIQKLDTESQRGERSIRLSQHKHLLPGFSLNRKVAFESIVKTTLSFSIDRDQAKAQLHIPELLPGINFNNPGNYPFYRFILNLGCVKDQVYRKLQSRRQDKSECLAVYTPWQPAISAAPSQNIEIQLASPAAVTDNCTIILGIGIQFGTALTDAIIQPVKYGGCAKIIGVA